MHDNRRYVKFEGANLGPVPIGLEHFETLEPSSEILHPRMQIRLCRGDRFVTQELLSQYEIASLSPERVCGGMTKLVQLDRLREPRAPECPLEPVVNADGAKRTLRVALRMHEVFVRLPRRQLE